MKKTEENRYPYSATLFKFCKEALQLRYEGNVKVIDQDVGAILGYDPADCSHWKKGKKNIRTLATLRSIADHLNTDTRLVIDIAAGKIELEEAIFEYKGYGTFQLNGESLEILKKQYFRHPEKWQKSGTMESFEELFRINRPALIAATDKILKTDKLAEAPIYLPEVIAQFTNITLNISPDANTTIEVSSTTQNGKAHWTIQCTKPDRSYVRFCVLKELFKILAQSENPIIDKCTNTPDEVSWIQANIFASLILIPGNLLQKEVANIDSSLDIVAQLANTFWVSKSLMNYRLQDYLEHLN